MDLFHTISMANARVGLNAPRLVVVTAPAVEPVTLAEAKLWLKLDTDTTDDALVTGLLSSARRVFEELTGRSVINTTWRAEWDFLPRAGSYAGAPTVRELELPRAPLMSVTHIKYSADDAAGTETTFASASYVVETGLDANRYGRLWLKDTADWPATGSFPGALRCQFVAGYGAATANVPEEIKVCVKLLVAHLYQNRTPVNLGNIVNEIPYSLKFLIEQHTIRSIT